MAGVQKRREWREVLQMFMKSHLRPNWSTEGPYQQPLHSCTIVVVSPVREHGVDRDPGLTGRQIWEPVPGWLLVCQMVGEKPVSGERHWRQYMRNAQQSVWFSQPQVILPSRQHLTLSGYIFGFTACVWVRAVGGC